MCLLLALAVVGGPAPAAQAGSAGACEEGEGVTVVVDFRSLGGDTIVRCAPSPVESGYDALTRAGLDWTPTQRHPGFLCRIEGLPADDPCMNTPPADAYWSYWRAEPGGSWRYSNYGPASTNPPPGPVEGWSFSRGPEDQPPRIAPPGSPAAEPPPPSPTSEPEPEPEPEPPATTAATPTAEPDPPTPPDSAPTAAATPTTATTPTDQASPTPERTPSPSPTPSVSPSPSASPTPAASASPTEAMSDAAAEGDSGSMLSSLVAVALVLGVGAGAVVTDRRRRRS